MTALHKHICDEDFRARVRIELLKDREVYPDPSSCHTRLINLTAGLFFVKSHSEAIGISAQIAALAQRFAADRAPSEDHSLFELAGTSRPPFGVPVSNTITNKEHAAHMPRCSYGNGATTSGIKN